MKKKLYILSICTFFIALAIFVFTYFLYHYMGSDGQWLTVWQPTPGKPFVTLLFGIWGVMFLFSSVMSALSAVVFCSDQKR